MPNAPTAAIGYVNQSYGTSTNMWWAYDGEATPELRWPQSVTVYDAMRTQDAQVGSVLEAVMRPVLRTPWRLDPAGARDEVVEFVADDLGLPIVGANPDPPPRTKDRFSWLEHLELALLMLPFGHIYFEVIYRVDDGGDRAHLRKLEPRMPKTIDKIDVARDGGLISITQCGTLDYGLQRPIPVDRLVAYIYKKEGGNWLGRSILRQAYKNWLIKDRLLRVQAQTIERNGMGIPTYTDAEGATPEQHAAGQAMAQALRSGEAAGIALPFGAEMTLMGVSGTLPDAQPAIDYHDNQIARAVLAHFLNLGQQTGTGSYALGVTFADFFTLSLQTLAQQIADVATQHIVEDLVDINWGPEEPAPKVTFDEIGSRQAATAQSITTLIQAGALTPDARLEESLRQQYGLPPRQTEPDTGTDEPLIPEPGQPEPILAGGIPKGERVEAGHPHPGQKYRHGWIPIDLLVGSHADEIAAAAYDAAAAYGDEERGYLAGRLLYHGGGVGPHGDEALHHIAAHQGFEGPATVVSRAEMDRQVKKGAIEMFRGVRPAHDGSKTASEIHEQFRSGPAFHGLGYSGNGTYLSSSRSEASSYGQVARYALRPGANVVDYRDLQQEQEKFLSALERYSVTWEVFQDPGRYAAARGYDAIWWRRGEEAGRKPGEEDEFIVLNRAAVLAEAQ